jgi:hypothetical protein
MSTFAGIPPGPPAARPYGPSSAEMVAASKCAVPCAGAPGLDYSCRECGRGGEIHSDRRRFRCVIGERVRVLQPRHRVTWLGRSRSARLLGRLAKAGQLMNVAVLAPHLVGMFN